MDRVPRRGSGSTGEGGVMGTSRRQINHLDWQSADLKSIQFGEESKYDCWKVQGLTREQIALPLPTKPPQLHPPPQGVFTTVTRAMKVISQVAVEPVEENVTDHSIPMKVISQVAIEPMELRRRKSL
jgi:hypothetical protein